jgi:predicted RNase H-like HicB family nuclease
MKRYRAVFERDESGAWIASVPKLPGYHTYGRTLEQARRRLREALSLWIDDVDSVELVEDVRLPARAMKAIRTSKEQRARADATRNAAQSSTTKAARTLVDDLHIGLRDAGELLGLSHQRIQQLVRN